MGKTALGVCSGVFGAPRWPGFGVNEDPEGSRCLEEGDWAQHGRYSPGSGRPPPWRGAGTSPPPSSSPAVLAELQGGSAGPKKGWGPHLGGSTHSLPLPSPLPTALLISALDWLTSPSKYPLRPSPPSRLFFMLSLRPSAISVPGEHGTPGLSACYSLCREGCFLVDVPSRPFLLTFHTCVLFSPPPNTRPCSIQQSPTHP